MQSCKDQNYRKKISKCIEPCGQVAALEDPFLGLLHSRVSPGPLGPGHASSHSKSYRAPSCLLSGTRPTAPFCPAQRGSCWALDLKEESAERAVIKKLLPVAKTALALAVTICLLLPISVSFHLSTPFLEAGRESRASILLWAAALPPACCSRCLRSPSGTPPRSLPCLLQSVLWLR